jgi:hypothetical protein
MDTWANPCSSGVSFNLPNHYSLVLDSTVVLRHAQHITPPPGVARTEALPA